MVGALATDKIVVDGIVGYMYREDAINDADSGWWFFSGTEDQDYIDKKCRLEEVKVNLSV